MMTHPDDLHRRHAVDLARLLATRELSANALAEALIERSTRLEPLLQAWAHFEPAHVRRVSRALDAGAVRGVLHGLPLAVKDNIDTGGLPTTYGSRIYAAHVPADDAACVALARAAGAWVPGKTVSTEFANFTPGPTRNPWNTAHTPGGSSSGSAAAVAAGLVPWALGTQTAGSVIRPAAFCGVVGYKPSRGRIPRAGVKANSDSLDEVGVLARCVGDAGLLAAVLMGDAGKPPPGAHASAPRIGFTLTSRADASSAEMRAVLAEAVRRASAAGASVHEIDWPADFDALFDAQRTVQLFETARALAPEWLYRRGELSPGLVTTIEEGRALTADGYRDALRTGRQAASRIEALWFGAVDVILTPAAPGAAPRGLETTGDPVFNRPWQLLGCPCVTLPAALDAAGLPLGLQLVGRPGDDERLLAAAAWFEREVPADLPVRGPLD